MMKKRMSPLKQKMLLSGFLYTRNHYNSSYITTSTTLLPGSFSVNAAPIEEPQLDEDGRCFSIYRASFSKAVACYIRLPFAKYFMEIVADIILPLFLT